MKLLIVLVAIFMTACASLPKQEKPNQVLNPISIYSHDDQKEMIDHKIFVVEKVCHVKTLSPRNDGMCNVDICYQRTIDGGYVEASRDAKAGDQVVSCIFIDSSDSSVFSKQSYPFKKQ